MLTGIYNAAARATHSLLTFFSTPTEENIHVVAPVEPAASDQQVQSPPLTSKQRRTQKKKEKKKLKKERILQEQTSCATIDDDPMELKEQPVASVQQQLEPLLSQLSALSIGGNDEIKPSAPLKLAAPFIPFLKPTDRVIPVEPRIQKLLTKLNGQGYWAYMVGGVVRDRLRGLPHHDIDIITNCPKEKLPQVLEIPCSPNVFKPELFQIEKDIDIICSTCSLNDELEKRDLTINSLIADANGIVYDPLNVIDDLKAPCLKMRGNVAQHLEEDPKKICRLVRLSNHVKKTIPPEYGKLMLQKATGIVTLAFSVYLKNIEDLFIRGKAFSNLYTLTFFQLSSFLLPAPELKRLTLDFSIYRFFLREKMNIIDNTEKTLREQNYNRYHFLALMLLPEIINQATYTTEEPITTWIEITLNFFCQQYKGEFSEEEKSCFKKNVSVLLQKYFQEYIQYHSHYIAYQRQQIEALIPHQADFNAQPIVHQHHRHRNHLDKQLSEHGKTVSHTTSGSLFLKK